MPIDYTHDMFLPDRRASKAGRQRVTPPRLPGPPKKGSQTEMEAWMRRRQLAKGSPHTGRPPKPPRRNPNSILEALIQREFGPPPVFEPDEPDESGVWAI